MRATALLLCLTAVACGDHHVPVLESGPPTYYEDITPILSRSCWCCHQREGVASSLEEVREVQDRIEDILRTMDDGSMPPGSASISAGCRPLSRDPLADGDVATIRQWNDSGRLLGDPGKAAALPTPCAKLSHPTRRFTNGGYTVSGTSRVESRCFALAGATSDTDRFLVGARFDPGSVLVRSIMLQPASVAAVGSSDGASCALEEGGVPDRVLALWFPRGGDDAFPSGTGIPVEAGTPLMLRVQYDTALAPDLLPARVETSVELAFVDSVERSATWVPAFDMGARLEPGLEEVRVSTGAVLPEGRRLHRVSALMYDSGRSARMEIRADGRARCLADWPSWDPLRVGVYDLAQPIEGSMQTLDATCTYDTSSATAPLRWGDPPGGEICLALYFVSRD